MIRFVEKIFERENVRCINLEVFYRAQSISFSHLFLSISLVFEKCLHHENHLWTENGDGWAAFSIVCFEQSIRDSLDCANAHRNKNISQDFCSDNFLITSSVNVCRHISLCDAGESFLTVKTEFNRSTHCSVRLVRTQDFGLDIHRSDSISLKIFFNDGGCLTQSCTEKHNQWASPSQWYGSCHNIITLTLSSGVWLNALKIFFHSG